MQAEPPVDGHIPRRVACRYCTARWCAWRLPPPPQRSSAYQVFLRERAIIVKRSVISPRTRLDGAKKSDFAHSNWRSGRARRPIRQLYTIGTVSRR